MVTVYDFQDGGFFASFYAPVMRFATRSVLIATAVLCSSLSTVTSNTLANNKVTTEQQLQAEWEKEERETQQAIKNFQPTTAEESRKNLEALKKMAPEKYEEATKVNILANSGKMGTVGDILITYDNKTSVWAHGHAAIVRDNNDYIVEAWPDVGVRVYQNNWANRFSTKKKFYVKDASYSKYDSAQKWAYYQVGDPYSLTATKDSVDKFYCSQLVWKAWNNTGYDLDADGGQIVTPADLEEHSLTIAY
ncbi:YiiX/YebB-like N1pC/P60 family cysteine hydrolase [Anoxybacillus sp. UARK-01]|uniref:YiiX/YebB-like N1pC/P60 family cysteine hydrolase n=1 Tax=Anoxybacillus sp. UARK-01 TaxID=1895648 RepID=UPI0011184770|nr:YiiX/YebB-like N1pC/P60 family cysteine hydrolase [Anoxybacillus sp. UARK-01]